jgi:hypothetical protein
MHAKWLLRYERKPGRWVFKPSPEARQEGADIKAAIEKRWTAPRYYYHLRRGGHVAALRVHEPHAYFVKADLTDFFGSISRSRLSRTLKNYFSHVEARRIATASTVQHPKKPNKTMLPYGFVQSPLLASLVLHKSGLGAFLDALHTERGLTVSVYVDDILVSGDDRERLQVVAEALGQRIAKSGFTPNLAKGHGPSQSTLAFNIELVAGRGLALVAERLRELGEIVETTTSPFQRAGVLGYVRSVNPEQSEALAGKVASVPTPDDSAHGEAEGNGAALRSNVPPAEP